MVFQLFNDSFFSLYIVTSGDISNGAVCRNDNSDGRVFLNDFSSADVPGAKGYEDENGPRMINTPWYEEPIPFHEAAEIGTRKVIQEHSTIGVVITTDGTIGDIARSDYIAI